MDLFWKGMTFKMTKIKNKKQLLWLVLIIISAIICVIYFGNKKAGFHEDEYYSYYSTNYVYGWGMPDSEWTPQSSYFNEFVVLEGQEYQYDLVKTVQSWDVHPPLYYWVLHTVCSLFPGIFSKWFGLSVNIFAYVVSIVFFYLIAKRLLNADKYAYIPLLATSCFAFSPAIISSAMFIRMYSLLTCFILMSFYLFVKAWQEEKITNPRFLIPMGVLVYLGFMTQYYFMIYLFFMTFATCVILLFQTKNLKKPFIYGITIVIPMVLAYITYPSCLGHMFRGQRGAQATSSFFDLSNTFERIKTFTELTDKYLFQGTFPFVVLLLVLTGTYLYWKNSREKKLQKNISGETYLVGILSFTVLGYMAAVSKTALMLGDTSVRYILPIFSLLLLAVVKICLVMQEQIHSKKNMSIVVTILLSVILIGNGYSIIKEKVLFLYTEDAQKVQYAKENSDIPVVYVYNAANSWCIWESSNELFEYPQVYFTSDAVDTAISDDIVQNSKELLVYVNTLGDTDKQIQRVLESNKNVTEYELVHEEKFCNLYKLH